MLAVVEEEPCLHVTEEGRHHEAGSMLKEMIRLKCSGSR